MVPHARRREWELTETQEVISGQKDTLFYCDIPNEKQQENPRQLKKKNQTMKATYFMCNFYINLEKKIEVSNF